MRSLLAALVLASFVLVAAGGCSDADEAPPSPVVTEDDAGAADAPDAVAETSTEASAEAPACAIPPIEATGAACTVATDCVVRYAGTFCCPEEPQALSTAQASDFDDALGALPASCRDACKRVRCGTKPAAKATCESGRCTVAPDVSG